MAPEISKRRAFAFPPITRRLLFIVGLFVLIVACLVFLTNARMEVQSAVRAYVGGEGLWSKGQKDAVHYLTRYARSHVEDDYQNYLKALAVPLGDQQARLELEQPDPDLAIVYEGFIQGRNHPEDVENMAWLFRRFRHVGYMARAIAVWTEGDAAITELRRRGDELHAAIASEQADPARIDAILEQIHILNQGLTSLEDQFSNTLGEANRFVTRVLWRINAAATTLLLAMGLLLSWLMLLQMQAAEEAQQRSSRQQQEFIANMSHELRSPLHVIIGYSDLLREGSYGALTARQTEVVQRTNERGRELLALIDATLDLSRLEARRVRLVGEEVRLSTLIDELASDFRAVPQKPDLQLGFDVPADLPPLRTDPMKLKMVLKNLVGNAIKFTDRGRVTVAARADDGRVEISVADTGIGIAPEAMPIIFEAFRQADNSTTRRHGGVGLGLYITRRLLDLLGGTITVDSKVGCGSTFRIALPLNGADGEGGREQTLPPPPLLERQR